MRRSSSSSSAASDSLSPLVGSSRITVSASQHSARAMATRRWSSGDSSLTFLPLVASVYPTLCSISRAITGLGLRKPRPEPFMAYSRLPSASRSPRTAYRCGTSPRRCPRSSPSSNSVKFELFDITSPEVGAMNAPITAISVVRCSESSSSLSTLTAYSVPA